MKTPDALRPGERLFALLLVIFAGYAFWESYEISGFRGLTTGGVMPMLASGVMLVTGLVIVLDTLRHAPAPEGRVAELVAYLFPLRVVLFTLLVAVYVFAIPSAGFLPASSGLLFIAIWALWKKGPVWALAIASLATGLIYFLFRVVFQVVLPVGSLWQ